MTYTLMSDVPPTLRPPSPTRAARTRRTVAAVGLAATLVQVVVWLMIAIVGHHLDSPWWLWTALATAVATAVTPVAVRHE